jgi:hypothetical protein
MLSLSCRPCQGLVALLFLHFARIAAALSEAEIQGFINEAIKAGGGEVLIPPGVHLIEKGLVLKDAKKVRLVGFDMEACVLKLPPLAYAETAEAVEAGAHRIATKRQQHVKPGMQLQIGAGGEMDAFTRKPKPSVLAVVKEIVNDAILIEKPLSHPVPAGAMIRDANAANLIEVRGASDDVRIEKLTLHGGRMEGDPSMRGHAQLCGVFASGAYTYEKGPTGPKPRGIAVSRCIIRECHGRGVAFYSVDGSSVEDCTIMDTTDGAVSLGFFTTKTAVRHNHIARSPAGVELTDANDCLVIANELRHCETGVHLWQWCMLPGLNQGNRIVNNLFLNTGAHTVRIQEGLTKNVVEGNEVAGEPVSRRAGQSASK